MVMARSPMDGTPMQHVRNMEARRTAADIIRERIAAREAGKPEPRSASPRDSDGRIIGGDLKAARELDEALAAAKRDRGR
jgi:hypothetical protein